MGLVRRPGRALLALGVGVDLLLLGYFKYAVFTQGVVNDLLAAQRPALSIILPIGISFYTFTQIAFLVDAYHGKVDDRGSARLRPVRHLLPASDCGPDPAPQGDDGAVRRAPADADRQRRHRRRRHRTRSSACSRRPCWRISGAAASPVVRAGGGRPCAARPVSRPGPGRSPTPCSCTSTSPAYSDMAIGLARLFGIRMPENFNSPYKARSIADFWQRWHMTLSRFLRDYLYIPLGGNRRGKAPQLRQRLHHHAAGRHLARTPAGEFMLLGALHGAYIVIGRLFSDWARPRGIRLPAAVGATLTFPGRHPRLGAVRGAGPRRRRIGVYRPGRAQRHRRPVAAGGGADRFRPRHRLGAPELATDPGPLPPHPGRCSRSPPPADRCCGASGPPMPSPWPPSSSQWCSSPMTSPNSSTSSSERGGRYLAVSLGLAAALLGALCLLSIKVKWFSDLPDYAPLLAYQLEKLDRSAGLDTVFVGDSSLGNAIDTETFDRLTGRRSANLALTGLFGYAGSYNMIRRAVEEGAGLRTVVIVQAADMMARADDLRGYVLSTPRVLDLISRRHCGGRWPGPGSESSSTGRRSRPRSGRRFCALLSRPVRDIVIENDYVKQASSRAPSAQPCEPKMSSRASSTSCSGSPNCAACKNLTCVYAHGPLAAELLDRSHGFFQAADRLIESTGLPLAAPEPVPLRGRSRSATRRTMRRRPSRPAMTADLCGDAPPLHRTRADRSRKNRPPGLRPSRSRRRAGASPWSAAPAVRAAFSAFGSLPRPSGVPGDPFGIIPPGQQKAQYAALQGTTGEPRHLEQTEQRQGNGQGSRREASPEQRICFVLPARNRQLGRAECENPAAFPVEQHRHRGFEVAGIDGIRPAPASGDS